MARAIPTASQKAILLPGNLNQFQAYRELAKLRLERGVEPPAPDDPVGRMQRRADALTRRAAAAKALAEAAAPLWQSFGDGQKRRFATLTRPSNFQPGFDARDGRGGFDGDRDRYDLGRGPRGFGPDGPGRDRDFAPRRFGFGGPRALDEKVESIVDSHDGTNQIQHPHWYKGASHEWGSLIPMICANVSTVGSG